MSESRSELMRRAGLYEVRKTYNRWLHGDFVELVRVELPPLEPIPRLKRHRISCVCSECLTAGQRRADYVKARALSWT